MTSINGLWMIDLGLNAAVDRLMLGSGPDGIAYFTDHDASAASVRR